MTAKCGNAVGLMIFVARIRSVVHWCEKHMLRLWSLKIEIYFEKYFVYFHHRFWSIQLCVNFHERCHLDCSDCRNVRYFIRDSSFRMRFTNDSGRKRHSKWCVIFRCDLFITFMGFSGWYPRTPSCDSANIASGLSCILCFITG